MSIRRSWFIVVPAAAAAVLVGCHSKHATTTEAKPHWSYEGQTGPAYWGTLSPEYALCATGTQQSPIDIVAAAPQDLANIEFNYQPVPVEILNNGHTVQVNYAAGSFITVDGQRFDLAQFHFHSPSEHTVNGRQAAAEMHLVHKSAAGDLAVVGVMLDEGPHNPRFDPVWNHLPRKAGPAQRTSATIDADQLLPTDQRTYRYAGSLTTPPGTEGVKWFLMTQPVTLSSEQIRKFRSIFYGNNRPTQPLNGRTIVEDSSK